MDKQKVRRASNWWIVIGFLLPLIAILGALMTDKDDGRTSKAVVGCLIWIIVAIIAIVLAVLAVVIIAGSSGPAAPFIYTLF